MKDGRRLKWQCIAFLDSKKTSLLSFFFFFPATFLLGNDNSVSFWGLTWYWFLTGSSSFSDGDCHPLSIFCLGPHKLTCYHSKSSVHWINCCLCNQGSCEALDRSCGCCGSFLDDEVQREQCESACDFATHVFCHVCALCQEARELRRRQPHPGFNAHPVLVMIPPAEQSMGRGAWKYYSSWECYFCMLLLSVDNI